MDVIASVTKLQTAGLKNRDSALLPATVQVLKRTLPLFQILLHCLINFRVYVEYVVNVILTVALALIVIVVTPIMTIFQNMSIRIQNYIVMNHSPLYNNKCIVTEP